MSAARLAALVAATLLAAGAAAQEPEGPAERTACAKILEAEEGWAPTGVVYVSGGLTVATGGAGGVRLWESMSARFARALPGAAQLLAAHPDGKHVVAAGEGAEVRLVELASGRTVGVVAGEGRPTALAVSPVGDWFAAATPAAVTVHALEDRREVRRLEQPGATTSLAFGPRGARLAAGGPDGVRLWDLATGELLRTLIPGQPVVAVAWAPHGGRLAAACADGAVWLLDAERGANAPAGRHAAPARCVAFSPDGAQLASGDEGGTLKVWSATGGAPLAEHPTPGNGAVTGVAFSPGGDDLVAVFARGLGRFWSSSAGAGERPAHLVQGWLTDPEVAFAQAREQGRPLLLDFFALW